MPLEFQEAFCFVYEKYLRVEKKIFIFAAQNKNATAYK